MFDPTIAETIFWIILAAPCILLLAFTILPFNKNFDPKADDPYRYCPKEVF